MTLIAEDFVGVLIRLNPDNTVDVEFKNVLVLDGVPVPGYVPQAGAFVFGARTGGANQTHWIDNLSISAVPEPSSAALIGVACGLVRLRRRRA